MRSLNRVYLIGNLTREVELRYTPKGTPVAEIGLALNRAWTDDEGRKREDAVFVDVSLWDRLAEVALQYLKKGSPVFVEGRLQLDSWTDKSGEKRSKLRVVATNLQLLGSKSSAPASGARAALEPMAVAPRSASTPQIPRHAQSVGIESDLDADVGVDPF
jgi:single-strand DNA-binding protein